MDKLGKGLFWINVGFAVFNIGIGIATGSAFNYSVGLANAAVAALLYDER